MALRFLLLLGFTGTCFSYIPRSTVKELYSHVTQDYDPRLKPGYDQSTNVGVYVYTTPALLLELDTTAQKMSMLMYFTFTWFDSFLMWNATEYDGIEYLKFKYQDVWHPTVFVGVSYEGENPLEKTNDQVLVYSNGSVMWHAAGIISVVCVMDITYYPFDTQECEIPVMVPYQLWGEVDLYKVPGESLQLIVDNPEWHILDFKTYLLKEYDENFIYYKFLFRRRASFIVYTTIVPLVLLSVLNACVILVPVSSGEKGSIAVTLFLSYCVYTTTIGATLPPNSTKISLILLYMTIVQIFSGLTMLYSVVETSQFIHGNHTWLLHCFSCVSRPMKYSDKDGEIKEADNELSKESSSEQVLKCFRILDYLFFFVTLLFNSVVIIVFSVMAARSLRETLD